MGFKDPDDSGTMPHNGSRHVDFLLLYCCCAAGAGSDNDSTGRGAVLYDCCSAGFLLALHLPAAEYVFLLQVLAVTMTATLSHGVAWCCTTSLLRRKMRWLS
jgi:hypothetical protein